MTEGKRKRKSGPPKRKGEDGVLYSSTSEKRGEGALKGRGRVELIYSQPRGKKGLIAKKGKRGTCSEKKDLRELPESKLRAGKGKEERGVEKTVR